jgi:hypothetical protein
MRLGERCVDVGVSNIRRMDFDEWKASLTEEKFLEWQNWASKQYVREKPACRREINEALVIGTAFGIVLGVIAKAWFF